MSRRSCCGRAPALRGRDEQDFAFLLANARAGQALKLRSFAHLDQAIGIWSYIRIANSVARQILSWSRAVGSEGQQVTMAERAGASPPRLLDWGCGYGQMTYLLQRRGLSVTPFDVGPTEQCMPDIPLCGSLAIVRVPEPTALPFASGTFDAVLSCGVLEHVEEGSPAGDERASLRELARVLRTGGALFIYQLPQRHAWQEALIRALRLGYAHPRRYTAVEIRRLLGEAGFAVRRLRRANLIPRNLTAMPVWLRSAYSRFSRILIALDGVLSHIPLLNRVAGVLEITAQKTE
jgi:SAM-dependent methyltransferase